MEKVKVLLLGDNSVARYALKLLADYDVYVIGDKVKKPSLPKGFHPKAAFCIKYPYVLTKSFIDRVGVPILNFHTAPLPELRGVDTTSWAIVHRLKRFGVTVHVITDKVDSGPVVLKKTYPITASDTAYSLYKKNLVLLKKIIKENLIRFVKGKYTTRKVSYFHKKGEFDYSNLKVDFFKPIEEADTFIRSRIFPGKQLPYFGDKRYITGCQITKNGDLLIELK